MKNSSYTRLFVGLLLILFARYGVAQPGPGPGYQCPACDVEYPGPQVLAEIISDFLDLSPGMVTVVQGDAPNVFTVTLPDGTSLSVTPVGIT